ncbi:P-loop containing nucleoside triphosphate hydrolase protein [Mycena rebaudengoi]|nr:P-loop containing nucleoside triphosphate hydrolase protein [Mycena rebaudengoi]
MPVQSRLDAHIRDALRSEKLLEKARKNAAVTREGGYCSAAIRAKIRNDFAACNLGKTAHKWQIDIGEALELGLDCSLLAGTGAGKTTPFLFPLFTNPDKIVIIISPLNALEEDQASKQFEEMGISAAAINGETYNDEIHKTKHIVSPSGDKFRPEYATLGTLRAFAPSHVPFLVASATLPPAVLAQVRQTMHIRADYSYHVNLGTDRPNIAWVCRKMNGAKSDLESLDFVVPPKAANDPDFILKLTMRPFRARLPPEMRHQIAAYNAKRTPAAKRRVLDEFRRGKIKILLTTEAAGMGCDMPYIEQVVQFMVPKSLSIWTQRAGRAGRTFMIIAH